MIRIGDCLQSGATDAVETCRPVGPSRACRPGDDLRCCDPSAPPSVGRGPDSAVSLPAWVVEVAPIGRETVSAFVDFEPGDPRNGLHQIEVDLYPGGREAGAALRQIRLCSGLTLRQASEATGLPVTDVSRWRAC